MPQMDFAYGETAKAIARPAFMRPLQFALEPGDLLGELQHSIGAALQSLDMWRGSLLALEATLPADWFERARHACSIGVTGTTTFVENDFFDTTGSSGFSGALAVSFDSRETYRRAPHTVFGTPLPLISSEAGLNSDGTKARVEAFDANDAVWPPGAQPKGTTRPWDVWLDPIEIRLAKTIRDLYGALRWGDPIGRLLSTILD